MAQLYLRLQLGRVPTNLNRLAARLPGEVASALRFEADMVYQMSQRLVPVSTPGSPHYRADTAGSLRDSGEVVPNGPFSVSVTYGRSGIASQYALAVHEHASAHSPRSWVRAEASKVRRNAKRPAKRRRGAVKFYKPGTGVKYLERPFKSRAAGMQTRIGNRLKSRLLRGG